MRRATKCCAWSRSASKANTKGRDTAARYGGEEFVVVLPQTSLENAITVAEQIRHAVESKKIVKRSTGETLGSITLSIGVAKYVPGEPIADTINRADACLYAAKRAGRNRVMSEWNVDATEKKSACLRPQSRLRDGVDLVVAWSEMLRADNSWLTKIFCLRRRDGVATLTLNRPAGTQQPQQRSDRRHSRGAARAGEGRRRQGVDRHRRGARVLRGRRFVERGFQRRRQRDRSAKASRIRWRSATIRWCAILPALPSRWCRRSTALPRAAASGLALVRRHRDRCEVCLFRSGVRTEARARAGHGLHLVFPAASGPCAIARAGVAGRSVAGGKGRRVGLDLGLRR